MILIYPALVFDLGPNVCKVDPNPTDEPYFFLYSITSSRANVTH